MKEPNTRETDELLLMQSVLDQGFDQPDLTDAVKRLGDCQNEGLQGYSIPNNLINTQ